MWSPSNCNPNIMRIQRERWLGDLGDSQDWGQQQLAYGALSMAPTDFCGSPTAQYTDHCAGGGFRHGNGASSPTSSANKRQLSETFASEFEALSLSEDAPTSKRSKKKRTALSPIRRLLDAIEDDRGSGDSSGDDAMMGRPPFAKVRREDTSDREDEEEGGDKVVRVVPRVPIPKFTDAVLRADNPPLPSPREDLSKALVLYISPSDIVAGTEKKRADALLTTASPPADSPSPLQLEEGRDASPQQGRKPCDPDVMMLD